MITALPRIAIATNDYESAVATFRDTLGMPVVDFSDRTVPSLGAHVGMCAPAVGSNVELMAPADPDAPLSRALQKFLDRRGDGIYALMLEAPDPDIEAEELVARGLDVLPLMPGASGRDVHPRSTHGVLIRVYPNDSAPTGGPHPSQAPGLSGIVRAVLATTDALGAAAAYGDGFGLDREPVRADTDRGVNVVECRAPKGGVIELVSVLDGDRPFARAIAHHLDTRGEGLWGLVLQANDPVAAAELLAGQGVAVTDGVCGPELCLFGARFLLEQA